ncbi:hypothetical protein RIF29_13636 [Crotalaria pallida]|uniref:Uncharacterized protein n=1 Tax=Crotalaria pallida TaxID=3830 RepID=A0AAN9IPV4_CROPI
MPSSLSEKLCFYVITYKVLSKKLYVTSYYMDHIFVTLLSWRFSSDIVALGKNQVDQVNYVDRVGHVGQTESKYYWVSKMIQAQVGQALISI